MSMFCFQCQEAAKGTGCTVKGVCGKDAATSDLQDLLLFVTKGISIIHSLLRMHGHKNHDVDKYVLDALFTTITNANFDDEAITRKIIQGLEVKKTLLKECLSMGITLPKEYEVSWTASPEHFAEEAKKASILAISDDDDIRGLKSLVIFGLKGAAAYAKHAANLGYEDDQIHMFIQGALAKTTQHFINLPDLMKLVMETGECGIKAMELLDKANTTRFGHPVISKVNLGVRSNPAILISGHDMHDMEQLLAQTEGTGVDVYTHSEMLPAHYYPAFKRYSHFVGNYGGSWWQQREDFEKFNGPILFTTNCIVPPSEKATYTDRIYTTGSAGLKGATHIKDKKDGSPKDFSAIIAHAKRCQPPVEIEKGELVGGFAHNQVFALADKVVEAVESGAIKKFVVMAGCDGRNKDREYYTDFAKELPHDTVILTAGCAKYRYNKLPLGDIGGIPRVLDAGQCNDSYSLVVIAKKLKEVFGLKDINELPIVYNIAWYEQKAVIVLLALLALGVKNIHLGPTLPAFLSPNILSVLVEKFGIGGITTSEQDVKAMIEE